jgi:hypothetical protein
MREAGMAGNQDHERRSLGLQADDETTHFARAAVALKARP